mmetsp:Transcript_38780/g.117144  ORF Transcript_38780/g.117144 Transcript_38780/m.117144 type:complete len:254 (+) Transcript_38780:19-780(+)
MSAMPPSIDTRALEPPTSATTVATTVASSVSHLCHFVHEWLDFRVPELLAAAEAVGVDVSATDADIDELSAGAGGVYLPVSCSSGSAGLARVAARAVLVKRFVEVWASGASIAELEGRLRACPAEVYAPYLREGSSFKVVVDGYGGSASEPDRLELITRLAKLLSPRGKVRLKSPDYTLVLLVDFVGPAAGGTAGDAAAGAGGEEGGERKRHKKRERRRDEGSDDDDERRKRKKEKRDRRRREKEAGEASESG